MVPISVFSTGTMIDRKWLLLIDHQSSIFIFLILRRDRTTGKLWLGPLTITVPETENATFGFDEVAAVYCPPMLKAGIVVVYATLW